MSVSYLPKTIMLKVAIVLCLFVFGNISAFCSEKSASLLPLTEVLWQQVAEKVHYRYASFGIKEQVKAEYRYKGKLTQNGTYYAHSKTDSIAFFYQKTEEQLPNGQSQKATITLRTKSEKINKVVLKLYFEDSIRFYGGGEQYSHFLLNNRRFPLLVEEQGIGRGDQPLSFFTALRGAAGNSTTTYYPLPVFISSDFRLFYSNNYASGELGFDRPKRKNGQQIVEISLRDTTITLVAEQCADYKQAVSQFTRRHGRIPPLPDWAFGLTAGLQGGSEKVQRIVAECETAGIPLSAVWIQDWVGRRQTKIGSRLWWNWMPDDKSYPNFAEFTAQMNSKGIKVLGYINPFLADTGTLFEAARQNGFLVKNRQGQDYKIDAGGFDAYMVDLFNPSAYQWLKTVIQNNLIGNGLSGWMADFAEWLPFDAQVYGQLLGRNVHNEYAVLWAKLNREAIEEAGKMGEIVFFTRSGYLGTQQYSPLCWMGDQTVTWGKNDGLPSVIAALNSGAMSGLLLSHADIGGYTSGKRLFFKVLRSEELFFRWAEAGVFMPFFRTHEGLTPTENFQFYDDKKAMQNLARLAKMHVALKEYFQYCIKEATDSGLPVNRPLIMEYPHDKNVQDLKTAFMLGSDVLVVPVLEAGSRQVNAYLPTGKWQHLLSGKIFEGGQFYSVPAPLLQPAAFVKVGSLWENTLRENFLLLNQY